MLRTTTCGSIRKEDIGTKHTLCGWVHTIRDHGGVTFIDLRDKYGMTQVVVNNFEETLGREYVVQVTGAVRARDEETYNAKIPTGEVELYSSKIQVLNKSQTPPFEIDDRKKPKDETRLRYRYIDLRRPQMQQHLRMRSKAGLAARNYLEEEGFTEVETPLLVRSTPEGARDYVVPSRVNKGAFYALPQSPQLYKQILMVSGVDKYYQFAKCLRDEDLRADRQPEFTQIDVEMSFAEQEDIFKAGEGIIKAVVKTITGKEPHTPFDKLTYKEAMEKYGTDKPDLRYELQIQDVTDIVKESDFSVFKTITEMGGSVKMLNPTTVLGRNEYDDYIKFIQEQGGKGMAWMKYEKGELESNIVKYFPTAIQEQLKEKAQEGSLLFIADKKEEKTLELAGKLRQKIAEDKGLVNKEKLSFAWIIDFPSFSYNEEAERWDPEHHMFTMPKKECLKYLEKDNFHPEKVLADCYDLVFNGTEIASGSIRIADPIIQEKVMETISYNKEEIEEKFGFLLEAFRYGAPPHGGFAIGYDRLIALLLGEEDIREVIAFPKTKSAESPLDGAPTMIKEKQLKELGLKQAIIRKNA